MTDMDVRISLVEQSYQNLEKRLDKVEAKIDDISLDIKNSHSSLIKVIIGTGGTLIASILSVVVVMLMN
jgi:tRNA A22 N-methylase